MPTREQLTHERLNALIEVLAAKGMIGEEWRESLESTTELGEGSEIAQAARNGQGPPTDRGNSGGNSP